MDNLIKGCLTKRRFTEPHIDHKIYIRRKKQKMKFYKYKCKECGYWHLTRSKQ